MDVCGRGKPSRPGNEAGHGRERLSCFEAGRVRIGVKITVTLVCTVLLVGCAQSHGVDRPGSDAGPAREDSGARDAGSADAGPFDCREIALETAECLGLTAPRCASCHFDAAADRWALCPEGVPPPFMMDVGPTPADCGIGP